MGINLTLKMINGKWKALLVCDLGIKSMRNGELLKLHPEISQKVLTEQLRELENYGIVKRTSYGTVPPKVVYSLTDDGISLRKMLVDLSIWGEKKAKKLNEEGMDIKIVHNSHEIMPKE